MNSSADTYFIDGCGRCALAATPACKVNKWAEELKILRAIVLDCGLHEECKWGVPVYTINKKNIVVLGAFKDNCVLSFFKGALLNDAEKILQKPGENTQAARVIRFTNAKQIIKLEATLKAFIFEAIEIEKAGLKVAVKENIELDYPEEFTIKLNKDSNLKKAFNNLTPGRQKAYLLYFSAAKQSKTRQVRIEKSIPQILKGKGLND